MAAPSFERVVLPSTHDDGQRVPGLRFGDPRVMALLAALCLHLHLPHGFSNALLRTRVAALQGKTEYSRTQMTYDLRRLRLKGLILRLPGTYRYVVTPAGRRIALFFSKTSRACCAQGSPASMPRHPSSLPTPWSSPGADSTRRSIDWFATLGGPPDCRLWTVDCRRCLARLSKTCFIR